MSPILFYGVPEGCSFASIVALEWSGAPYHLCRIEMPKVVSSKDYRRINAIGETPSLMLGDGRVISESMAILNHIASGHIRKGLGFAQASPEFDQLNQMLAYLNTSFFNAFSPLWHTIEHELEPDARKALTAYGVGKVEKVHRELEQLLGGRKWLLGKGPSLADAYFAGIARWNDFHDVVDRKQFPALNSLYERLQENPAVRFALAIEHEEPAESTGDFRGHVTLEDALGYLKHAA